MNKAKHAAWFHRSVSWHLLGFASVYAITPIIDCYLIIVDYPYPLFRHFYYASIQVVIILSHLMLGHFHVCSVSDKGKTCSGNLLNTCAYLGQWFIFMALISSLEYFLKPVGWPGEVASANAMISCILLYPLQLKFLPRIHLAQRRGDTEIEGAIALGFPSLPSKLSALINFMLNVLALFAVVIAVLCVVYIRSHHE